MIDKRATKLENKLTMALIHVKDRLLSTNPHPEQRILDICNQALIKAAYREVEKPKNKQEYMIKVIKGFASLSPQDQKLARYELEVFDCDCRPRNPFALPPKYSKKLQNFLKLARRY